MSVLLRDPVIEKVSRKRVRRANSTEKLQEYTQYVMEKYAKRSIGQARIDVEGLRSAGAEIFASNIKSFAQEAAERVPRAREFAEFVDNIQRGQKTRTRHPLRSPSLAEIKDDGNDDGDDVDNDKDDEDDDNDVDDDRDYRIEDMLRREGEEMDAKQLRLRTYYGAVSEASLVPIWIPLNSCRDL